GDSPEEDRFQAVMTLGTLLEMATYEHSDRVLIGSRDGGLTGAELAQRAAAGARVIRDRNARHVAFVGVNSPAVPVTVLAAALAGVPVTPINYRLAPEPLRELLDRLPEPIVITDPAFEEAIGWPADGAGVLPTPDWLALTAADPARAVTLPEVDVDSCAVMLFTSGTTSAPKGVLLRHAHLTSYVLQTVEFGSADADDATLVSVPPYHVAGIGTVLSNLYAGRRVTYLSDFTAEGWLRTVADEQITNAMLVPTMLVRIVEHLDGVPAQLPALRSVAYGGARFSRAVLEKALAAFPNVGFTNAYGLTETSSTIAVLGPDDHRAAMASSDPVLRARLSSAGRVVPGIEAQMRDSEGAVLQAGETGELW